MGKVYKNTVAIGPDKKIYGVRTRKGYDDNGKTVEEVTNTNEVTDTTLNIVALYMKRNNLSSIKTQFGKLVIKTLIISLVLFKILLINLRA